MLTSLINIRNRIATGLNPAGAEGGMRDRTRLGHATSDVEIAACFPGDAPVCARI